MRRDFHYEILAPAVWAVRRPMTLAARHRRDNPAAAGPPRHPPAAGGHKVAPFTSPKISSQREEIEKRSYVNILMNT